MKLSEILAKLDKSKKNTEWVDSNDLRIELGLQEDYDDSTPDFDDRVKCYWISSNQCTDTMVGMRAYFLDDKIVAISKQKYRKSDEMFYWASVTAMERVRSYLLTTPKAPSIQLFSLNEEMGEGFTSENVNLGDTGMWNNLPVRVVKCYGYPHRAGDSVDTWETVDVEFENGVVQNIKLAELILPYYITEGN